jgi:FtsP/CotA-like multicopper oxidase with cupredoxin domain
MFPAARSAAFALASVILGTSHGSLWAQGSTDPCHRPFEGATVPEPEDLRSRNGELAVDLEIHNYTEANGSLRFCYVTPDGKQAPTLRLNPGNLLILNLKNGLTDPGDASASSGHHHAQAEGKDKSDPCASDLMRVTSTNLHFHGLTIPAVCHQDDVLHTSIQPGAPFQYRFRIPANEPPGLYWYHPHIHGFSKVQVLGGASGALIIEGIERANKEVAGCRSEC